MPAVKGSTRLFAVIGDPVEHSLSPLIHNTLFERHGLDAVYVALPVRGTDFVRLVRSLWATSCDGLNITSPYKEDVLSCVESTALSEAVTAIGAANTLVRAEDGWSAVNTDGTGLCDFVELELGIELDRTDVLVLGAGPAARAVLHELGHRRPAGLTVVNRTPGRLRGPFFDWLASLAPAKGGVRLMGTDGEAVEEALASADLVVNATGWGRAGGRAGDGRNTAAPWRLSALSRGTVVIDANYGHERNATPFLGQLPRWVDGMDGRGMLRWQAYHAFKAWTGIEPGAADRRAVEKRLQEG